MTSYPPSLFEPFDDLSVDNNQVEEPIFKVRKSEPKLPKIPKEPKELKQKTVASIAKILESKKGDSNPTKRAACISRIDKYLQQFKHTSVEKSYEKKKYDLSEEELHVIEQTVVNQIADKTQFELGEAIFCEGVAKIPVVANGLLPLDKRYCIDNFPQYVRQNYETFKPTWTELIIKYNLFATGPELRLIILLIQAVHEVDSANRHRVGDSVKRAEKKKSSNHPKFDGL
jgi:hypothetical protein